MTTTCIVQWEYGTACIEQSICWARLLRTQEAELMALDIAFRLLLVQ